MILDFKQRDLRLPVAMAALALLLLTGSLLLAAFAPAPGAESIAHARARTRRQMRTEIAQVSARSRELEQAVRPRLWQGSIESITSLVLKEVADQARGSGVKLTGFRPQKVQALKGVVEVPFAAHVTGRYPSVRAMVAALDAPGTRIALRSVQFASADDASSAVTVALNMSVFVAETSGMRTEIEDGGSVD